MKVDLVFVSNYPYRDSLRRAAEMVNFAQNFFFVSLREIPDEILTYHENRPKLAIYSESADLVRGIANGHKTIYVTDSAFDNNYFSGTYGDVAVVSTNGWSENYAPPSLAAYTAREIVLSSLCFAGNLLDADIDRLSMEPSNGCIFDFCANKTDVRFGLAAGYIHPDTRAKLSMFGVHREPIEAAEKILDLIRLEAIGKPAPLAASTAFIVMKFSNNDENSNAYKHGIKPALEAFGLESKRADEDPRMQVISDKVMEHIKKSRLVVIKVDEPNLNVFFELGYAVASRKEVLLICERDKFSGIPSDIKGWELLKYPKGDYEALKTATIAYLKNMLPYRH